ncbi:MAG: motif [Chlamydiota bacterium]|jgi:hypothetical protein
MKIEEEVYYELTFFGRFTVENVGRNDPCPCGSGKKLKKCCGLPKGPKKINAQVLSSSHKLTSLFKTATLDKSPKEDPHNHPL